MRRQSRTAQRAQLRLLASVTYGAALFFALSRPASAENTTAVWVEGVSTYSTCNLSNIDGAEEANGFLTTMTANGTGWTKQGPGGYFNSNVWDIDFVDPDYSHSTSDDDTVTTDNLGTGIAFLAEHGICDDVNTQTPCTTSSQCNGGYCPALPPTSTSSACISNFSRHILTCGSAAYHNNDIQYAPGKIKWGEDALSGGWAGAAQNGDDNVVFLVNSCGAYQPYLYNQSSSFAGMQLLNMIMPTGNLATPNGWSDTTTWSARGSTLATSALMNPFGKITDSWAATLDSAPNNTANDACPNLDSNYQYGGSHGIHGCGGHVSIAMDSTDGNAQTDINMTWSMAKANFSLGISYWYWQAHCNYNCFTYGFKK